MDRATAHGPPPGRERGIALVKLKFVDFYTFKFVVIFTGINLALLGLIQVLTWLKNYSKLRIISITFFFISVFELGVLLVVPSLFQGDALQWGGK